MALKGKSFYRPSWFLQEGLGQDFWLRVCHRVTVRRGRCWAWGWWYGGTGPWLRPPSLSHQGFPLLCLCGGSSGLFLTAAHRGRWAPYPLLRAQGSVLVNDGAKAQPSDLASGLTSPPLCLIWEQSRRAATSHSEWPLPLLETMCPGRYPEVIFGKCNCIKHYSFVLFKLVSIYKITYWDLKLIQAEEKLCQRTTHMSQWTLHCKKSRTKRHLLGVH